MLLPFLVFRFARWEMASPSPAEFGLAIFKLACQLRDKSKGVLG